MNTELNDLASLQRALRDLVALTTLPAIWTGKSPHEIAESFSDLLFNTFHLDMVYIQLKQPFQSEDHFELVRTSQRLLIGAQARDIGKHFAPMLKPNVSIPVLTISDPFEDSSLQIGVIPLGHNGIEGFAVAGTRSLDSFTELKRVLLGVAANQVVTAIRQAQLVSELRTANEIKDESIINERAAHKRVTVLQSITNAFAQTLTISQVAKVVVDDMVNAIEAIQGTFYCLVNDELAVQYQTGFDIHTKEPDSYSLDPALQVTQVIGSQLPLWLEKAPGVALTTSDSGADNGSIAILPLFIREEKLGAIEVVFPSNRVISQEEHAFLIAVSYQCAQALERARLYEAEREARKLLNKRVKLQSLISTLGHEALLNVDLSALMNRAVTLLAQALEVEYSKILELIPSTNQLLLKAGVGWKDGLVGQATVSGGMESQAGYTLRSQGPVIVEDLLAESRFNGPPLLSDHGVRSGISVIIEGHEKPWGILGIHSIWKRTFNSDDIYFVQSVANILAAALEQARLDSILDTHRQWLKNIVDTVPGVIWENQHDDNEAMRLTFISAYVETMLGYTVEEALADPHFWFKIFHPDDAQSTAEAFYKVRQSGGSGVVNFRTLHKDGHIIDVQALMTTIMKDEKPVGKRGVMMDVSERQRLIKAQTRYAEMLRRSNQELQQFAYIASHDLQEPLRSVSGFMQLLEKRYANKLDEDGHEFIKFAVDAAAHMKELIDALLAYSRVDQREKALDEFDVQTVLNKTLHNLAFQIDESGALITHDPMPKIRADSLQITQVFQNLIGNAIKFRQDNTPQIYIGVEYNNNEWQFLVRDNGIGIPPDALGRVFSIFQRLHTKEEYPGAGIGLAICKKVIEGHGGRIWVESTLGQGTTFYFTVPV